MTEGSAKGKAEKSRMLWLVYVALALSGLLILGTDLQWPHISRWTARLGVALLYSAFALGVANGRKSGLIAAVLIWLAAVACWFI